ncbi:MAG: CDP-diacylglycerol--serine O-phosphatidyltransferase [Bacteroidales bacterium]|nr:CDP-diacylglycerol--serine O-phosphatidyltransferase [Bacteroidales bacterium]
MKHIPNFITCLNLAAGFISLVFAVNGDVVTASWLIIAAMIFDWFDGFSARLLKAYSDIGKELDSLADAVSFGIAPALIMYHLLGSSLSLTWPMITNASGAGDKLILFSPVIMCVCAVLRLAVFNTDESQVKSFKGLPTPANALAVISLVIAAHYSDRIVFKNILESTPVLLMLTVALSLLMVSRIPLISLKIANLKLKGNEGRYLLIILVAAAFVFLGIGAITLIIPFYLIVSIISPLFR